MFIFLFVAYRLRLRRHQHHLIVTIFLVVNVAIVATVLYPPLFVTFHPPVSPLNLLHTSGSWLISYNMNVHRVHAANFLDAFSSLLLFLSSFTIGKQIILATVSHTSCMYTGWICIIAG